MSAAALPTLFRSVLVGFGRDAMFDLRLAIATFLDVEDQGTRTSLSIFWSGLLGIAQDCSGLLRIAQDCSGWPRLSRERRVSFAPVRLVVGQCLEKVVRREDPYTPPVQGVTVSQRLRTIDLF